MTQENEVQHLTATEPLSTAPASVPDATRRKRFLLVAACSIIVLVCVGTLPRLLLRRQLRSQASAQATAAANVFVIPAQPSPPFVSVQLSGTMSPITEAPVLARTDGYLKKRLVDIGDRVSAGQVVGVIEAPELDQQVQQARALYQQSQSTLDQSRAALEQAKANAGIAGITAERWAALVKRGAVSRQANDNYQFAYNAQLAAVGVATASVAAANNSVGANAANLDHYRELQSFEVVRAPFAGLITQRNVDEGALVTATDTLLFRVAKTDTLRTFIDVPQINAPSIHVGDIADLTFVQFPGHTFRGTITRSAGSLNLNTRTLLTEVDLDNHDGKLLPGMYATVTFNLPRTVSSILIPSEALVFRADGTSVAVVDQNHRVRFRKIVVGHDYGSQIEIISGLAIGESVIVNPNDTTSEDARVNPVTVKQASGSLASASRPSSTNPSTSAPATPGRGH